MQVRTCVWLVAMWMATTWGVRAANGLEPSRLAALTARQSLRDRLCIALSDGVITRAERYTLLVHAKSILTTSGEYQSFKRTLERLSPSKMTVIEQSPTETPFQSREYAASENPQPAVSSQDAGETASSNVTEMKIVSEAAFETPIAPEPPVLCAHP